MAKRRGEIVAVKDLFEKYRKTLKAPQKTVEMEVVRVVGEVLGIKLDETKVEYTPASRVVFLNVSSLIKQEIKFHNEKILNELKKRLGEKSSPNTIL